MVYSDIYLDWLLGAGDGSHPNNPVKAKLATELLVERLGAAVKVLPPVEPTKVEADLAALKSLHDEGYVTRTLQGDNGEWSGQPEVAPLRHRRANAQRAFGEAQACPEELQDTLERVS